MAIRAPDGANKSHVVDAGLIQKPCFHQFSSDPSLNIALLCPSVRQSVLLLKFVQIGLLKVVTWISLSC